MTARCTLELARPAGRSKPQATNASILAFQPISSVEISPYTSFFTPASKIGTPSQRRAPLTPDNGSRRSIVLYPEYSFRPDVSELVPTRHASRHHGIMASRHHGITASRHPPPTPSRSRMAAVSITYPSCATSQPFPEVLSSRVFRSFAGARSGKPSSRLPSPLCSKVWRCDLPTTGFIGWIESC